MYVLRVEPKRKDRFLYRGRIWVDAKDFAVVRIEADPAKSLSFWVRSTEFRRVYRRVGDFWLPARNRSVSQIRFGGSAKMTIQYTNYEIRNSDAVGNLPASDLERTASSVGAQPAKPQARAEAAKESSVWNSRTQTE